MKLKIGLNKKTGLILTATLVFALFFVVSPVRAEGLTWAASLVGGIAQILVSVIGWVLSFVMGILIYISQYNNFIGSRVVEVGWVIVRDICNMFFVIVLLVIAFATILKLENYSYKKWLPKLILMAILINFSKTICGIIIDAAQIVMLTFVNAFKDIGGGNLVDLLGIQNWQSLKGIEEVSSWEITAAYVLSVIYAAIALIVVTAMVAMLVMRIIMIWIYVVLSPLAYLMSAFPGGAKYASSWWSDFIKNLIVGPVLAFFIWLSFTSLANFQTNNLEIDGTIDNRDDISCETGNNGVCKVGTSDVLLKFIIAIGMLLGGLKITSEIGGEAAKVAGKVSEKGFKFAKEWGGRAVSGDNLLARKTMKAAGFDIRPMKIAEAIKASYQQTRKKDEDAISLRGAENMSKGGYKAVLGGVGAGVDWANNYADGFLGTKGIYRAGREIFVRPFQRKSREKELDEVNKDLKSDQELLKNNFSYTDWNKDSAEIKENNKNLKEFTSAIIALESKQRKGIELSDEEEEKLGELNKSKNELEEINKKKINSRKDKGVISDDDYKKAQGNIIENNIKKNKIKERLDEVAPPQALEGLGAYRKTINESKAKYKDETNSDKLIQFYNDAVRRNDKFDQTALLEKLSNDGNLNEILTAKGYSADAKGLHSFVFNMPNADGDKNGLKGKQFKDDSRLRILNDLSESEERVGHWEMAKMVGVNDKGKLESLVKPTISADGKVTEWDDSEHAVAAASEIAKMDPQKIVLMLNRLAYGGEDAGGTFQLSTLGRVLAKMLDNSGAYESQKGRIQSNIATNLTQPHILEELRKMNISLGSINALQSRAAGKPADLVKDVLADLKNRK